VLTTLSGTVIGPLAAGQLVQYVRPGFVPWLQARLNFQKTGSAMILLLVWHTFCNTFAKRVQADAVRAGFGAGGGVRSPGRVGAAVRPSSRPRFAPAPRCAAQALSCLQLSPCISELPPKLLLKPPANRPPNP